VCSVGNIDSFELNQMNINKQNANCAWDANALSLVVNLIDYITECLYFNTKYILITITLKERKTNDVYTPLFCSKYIKPVFVSLVTVQIIEVGKLCYSLKTEKDRQGNKQDRQCRYDVTLRGVHGTTADVEKQNVLPVRSMCACVWMWLHGRVYPY
jgi:hypothetical protein